MILAKVAATTSTSTEHIIIIGVIEALVGAFILAVIVFLLRSVRSEVGGWFQTLLTNVQDVNREVKPNGGNTNTNGDRTRRIEEKIDGLSDKMDRTSQLVATQKGHTDAIETEVFRRISQLERERPK